MKDRSFYAIVRYQPFSISRPGVWVIRAGQKPGQGAGAVWTHRAESQLGSEGNITGVQMNEEA